MPQKTIIPFVSLPTYPVDSEVTVVDLTKDGLPFIPVFGDAHYSRPGDGTVPHVHPGMIEILFCRRGEELSFDCAGEVVPFRVGDVFVAQPETPHFLRKYPKSLAMHWLWIRLPRARETVAGLSPAETRWLVARLRALPVRIAGGAEVGPPRRAGWSRACVRCPCALRAAPRSAAPSATFGRSTTRRRSARRVGCSCARRFCTSSCC